MSPASFLRARWLLVAGAKSRRTIAVSEGWAREAGGRRRGAVGECVKACAELRLLVWLSWLSTRTSHVACRLANFVLVALSGVDSPSARSLAQACSLAKSLHSTRRHGYSTRFIKPPGPSSPRPGLVQSR